MPRKSTLRHLDRLSVDRSILPARAGQSSDSQPTFPTFRCFANSMKSKKSFCFPRRVISSALVVSIVTLLAACGGGQETPSAGPATADSPAYSSVPTPESQPVISGPAITIAQPAISTAQAARVAAISLIASEFLFNTSGNASQYITGVATANRAPDAGGLAQNLMEYAWGDLRLSFSPTQGIVQACPAGGSLASVASNSGASNLLDTVSMVAHNCSMNGFTMNGRLVATIASQTGFPVDGRSWDATDLFRFSSFSATSAAASAAFDGDMTLDMSFTASGARTFTLSGAAIHVTAKLNGQPQVDLLMQQYKATTNFAPGTVRSIIEFTQQSVDSTGQPSLLVVKTPQVFVRTSGQYSSSGVLSVSDDVSSATVTALDDTSVRVDYRPASDGAVTESNSLTWLQFMSLN
jgi:hypothetical protein